MLRLISISLSSATRPNIKHYSVHSTTPRHTVFESILPKIKHTSLSLPDFVLDNALDHYKDFAMVSSSESLTYGKFKERVNDLAIHFYIREWKQGETVAIIMPNLLVFPLTVFAATKIGLPVTLVNPKYKSREMVKQLKSVKASYIITTNHLLPYIRDAVASLRNVKEILVLDREETEEEDKKEYRWSNEIKYNLLLKKPPAWGALPDWEIVPSNSFCFSFTDGGTKGVELTHRNLSASIAQLESIEKDLTRRDVVATMLPYSDLMTWSLVCFAFYKGSNLIVMEGPEHLETLLVAIAKHNVTYIVLSAVMAIELADSDVSSHDLNSLKTILITQPVDTSVIHNLQAHFPNVAIKQAYGITDLSPPIIFTDVSTPPGSVGALLPENEAKIIHPNTREQLDINKEGELYVKGSQIMEEYYNNSVLNSDTQKVDSNGFINTGDIAQVDKSGYWTVTLKKKLEEE